MFDKLRNWWSNRKKNNLLKILLRRDKIVLEVFGYGSSDITRKAREVFMKQLFTVDFVKHSFKAKREVKNTRKN